MSIPRRTPLLVPLSLFLTGVLLVPGPVAATLFALGAVAFPVALIKLGTRRDGDSDRRLTSVLLVLLAILELSVVGVLALSGGSGAETTAAAGVPWASIVQIVGLWLLPLPVVALAYALTFDRSGVREDDLESLRRRYGGRAGAGRRGT